MSARADPAPEPVEAGAFAMWIFIASEAMLFGALLLVYAIGRIGHPAGFETGSGLLDWRLGLLNTAVLLTSSLVVARTHAAAREGGGRGVALGLAATAALGLLFLGIKGHEWLGEIDRGLAPFLGMAFEGPDQAGTELFLRAYFVLTGLHALHLAAGVGWAGGLLALRVTGRAGGGSGAVRAFGLYWHFVDIVWIFLFPLLYLAAPS